MKTVLVFGVFDRLHDGHVHFLKASSEYGDLHVVIARDDQVSALKNKKPIENEETRKEQVEQLDFVKGVHLGDEEQGRYSALTSLEPDIICLGYDQDALGESVRTFCRDNDLNPVFIRINGYNTDKLKSSLLNNYD
jgi:FAD synthetase